MSILGLILPKLQEISNAISENINNDVKEAFDLLDRLENDLSLRGKAKAREKVQKIRNTTTLQKIEESDDISDEVIKVSDAKSKKSSSDKSTSSQSSNESVGSDGRARKRSKNEVDGMVSPEDKRKKRNASVKAQSIIAKQVNVNLTQKLRRENTSEKTEKDETNQSSRSKRKDDDEKENNAPNLILPVQIKQEKISLPSDPEPMETESLSVNIDIKQEKNKDDIAMPPPAAPVPKPRKGLQRQKSNVESSEDESTGKRSTRTKKKQTDAAPPVAAGRPTRASSRARAPDLGPAAPPEPRPKRTRPKKNVSTAASGETEKESVQSSGDSVPVSPAEKPRPKRTRRAQKAAENAAEPPPPPEPAQISPKEEKKSQDPLPSSPILPIKELKVPKNRKGKANPEIDISKCNATVEITAISEKELSKYLNGKKINNTDSVEDKNVDRTESAKVVAKKESEEKNVVEDVLDNAVLNETKIISKDIEMDKTMVLPNAVYNHAETSPKNVRNMNETVVIERCDRATMVLDKPHNVIMDSTVILDKAPKPANITDDNSLITDDSDTEPTTPTKNLPVNQPTSAVKEKVQQFEEMASRITRTKTRAMAKKDDDTDTQTPPDKVIKTVLSSETITKMSSLIFNEKPPQISSSACKPRANLPSMKSLTNSTSKLSAINKAREMEESLKREDARKKKEAMLEAKREQQKRKREEKMAAAAAARNAAERERKLAAEAAARERMEKLHTLEQGKIDRNKELERKKQELARKVAETEERRKAEEAARQQRLVEEQRRAQALRKKQIEEQEAMRKEAAMAREMEQKQKEYFEKQKKQRLEEKLTTPFKTPATPQRYGHMPPVHMEDGFQYLNSDEEEEPADRPIPDWSTSKARKLRLEIQAKIECHHIDKLFSVRVHSPDLRDIFPNIERARLKRTSSAVWRTPPQQS